MPEGIDDTSAAGPDLSLPFTVELEFQSHLDAERDRLMEQGVPRDEAAARALAEFGDVQSYLRVCKQTSSGRLKRAAWLGIAACIGLLGLGLAWQASRSRTAATEHMATVSRLQAEIDSLRSQLVSVPGPDQPRLAQAVRFVVLKGEVVRPNVWVLDKDAVVTLRQLLHKAGGLRSKAKGEIQIARASHNGSTQIQLISPGDWYNPDGPDPALDSSMTIEVR